MKAEPKTSFLLCPVERFSASRNRQLYISNIAMKHASCIAIFNTLSLKNPLVSGANPTIEEFKGSPDSTRAPAGELTGSSHSLSTALLDQGQPAIWTF